MNFKRRIYLKDFNNKNYIINTKCVNEIKNDIFLIIILTNVQILKFFILNYLNNNILIITTKIKYFND